MLTWENVNDILLSKKSRLHYGTYSMIHSFSKFLIRTQTKSLINVIFFSFSWQARGVLSGIM